MRLMSTARIDWLTRDERSFDTWMMLTGRQDIVGDLARLRVQFLSSQTDADSVLDALETLAAAAVALAMSYPIVGKASGIPRERIDAVQEARPTIVERCARDYERHPSGVVCRRLT